MLNSFINFWKPQITEAYIYLILIAITLVVYLVTIGIYRFGRKFTKKYARLSRAHKILRIQQQTQSRPHSQEFWQAHWEYLRKNIK